MRTDLHGDLFASKPRIEKPIFDMSDSLWSDTISRFPLSKMETCLVFLIQAIRSWIPILIECAWRSEVELQSKGGQCEVQHRRGSDGLTGSSGGGSGEVRY